METSIETYTYSKKSQAQPNIKLNRLVIVRYYDHVEFRRIDHPVEPCLREAVGWIIHENEDYIVLLSEKAVTLNPEEVARLRPSGFVILKSAIKEIHEIG